MSTGGCFDAHPCCMCPCCPYRCRGPQYNPWWEYVPSNPWNPTLEYGPPTTYRPGPDWVTPTVTCGTDSSAAASDVRVTVTYAAPEQAEPTTVDAPEVKDSDDEEHARQFEELLEQALREYKRAWERLANL